MKITFPIFIVVISLLIIPSHLNVYAGTTPPLISDIDYSPRIPTSEDEVIVNALVVDNESGVDFVTLLYTNDTSWNSINMSTIDNSTFYGGIPKHPSGTQIQFKVFAQDKAGNPAESNIISYHVTVHVSPTGLIFFMYVLVLIAAMGITLTLLIWRVKPTAFCPNCGAKTTSRAIFCPECGKKIK